MASFQLIPCVASGCASTGGVAFVVDLGPRSTPPPAALERLQHQGSKPKTSPTADRTPTAPARSGSRLAERLAAVHRAREEIAQRFVERAQRLGEGQSQASKNRRSLLVRISGKAQAHAQCVAARAEKRRQQLREAAENLQAKLLCERAPKLCNELAAAHNKVVAEVVQRNKRCAGKRTQEQLNHQAPSQRAADVWGQKAAEHNKLVAQKLRERQEAEKLSDRGKELRAVLSRASDRRDEILAAIKGKAQAHIQAVAEKVEQHQQICVQRAEHIRQMLQQDRPTARSIEQAAEHNKIVAAKLQQHQELERETSARGLELQSALERACERRDEMLAALSNKAKAHSQAAAVKCAKRQQDLQQRIEFIQQQLQQERSPANRSQPAADHNRVVRNKLQQRQLEEQEVSARVLELQSALDRACERRDEVLAAVVNKAQAHSQAVDEKRVKREQDIQQRTDSIQQQLQQERSPTNRSQQAAHHNRAVTDKRQQRQGVEQTASARALELQSALERACERRNDMLLALINKAKVHSQAVAEKRAKRVQGMQARIDRIQHELQQERTAADRSQPAADHNRSVTEKLHQHQEKLQLLATGAVDLESALHRAVERRHERLAEIRGKARAHVQAVAEKVGKRKMSLHQQAEHLRQQLQQDRAVKALGSRAAVHNKLVSEKLQLHRTRLLQHAEKLRAKASHGSRGSSALSRGACSARHNRDVHSKVLHHRQLLAQRRAALEVKLREKAARAAQRRTSQDVQ